MNNDSIVVIIKDIERFFADLESFNIKTIKDISNKEKFYATSMLLFSIINRVIDLGEEIISERRLGFPSKYKEIFDMLYKNNYIDKKLHNNLASLVYFRNLAAHEYYTFREEDVFKAYQKISSVKHFIAKLK